MLLDAARAARRRRRWRRAVAALVAHHDALRLRFARERRRAGGRPRRAAGAAPLLRASTSRRCRRARAGAALETAAAAAPGEPRPRARARCSAPRCFDLGGGRPARLLLVVHHLVVDGVSWRILLEDLETAYRQLARGEAVALPPKTTSFQRWAERLAGARRARRARGASCRYWLARRRGRAPPLPVDRAGRRRTPAARRATVAVALDAEETRALLQEVPAVYRTQINDVLLAALGRAFARAGPASGALLVDLEGHGREEIFAGRRPLAHGRLVHHPLPGAARRCAAAAAPARRSRRSRSSCARCPERGLGYGLLRYLAARRRRRSRRLPAPRGRLQLPRPARPGAAPSRRSSPARAEAARRRGERRRGAAATSSRSTRWCSAGGCGSSWTYSAELPPPRRPSSGWPRGYLGRAARRSIDALPAAGRGRLHAVGLPARRPRPGGARPPAGGGDRAARSRTSIPLSPLQAGHALPQRSTRRARGVYFEQLSLTLAGALDAGRLERAWQRVVERATRSCAPPSSGRGWSGRCRWCGGGWSCRWSRRRLARAAAGGAGASRLDALLRGGPRAAASTSRSAPLMRLTLVRTGDAERTVRLEPPPPAARRLVVAPC